ncbi:MAG TPA: glucose-6-phosphate dehydrogenase [Acidimicrobiia bacterium]|nr:glucose-6-phosphate dehydrogenase [Acidimicrobiia bacterium]
MSSRPISRVDPHVFVIFGGTGDLAQRKLIPSLYRLIADHEVRDRCVVLGVSRREVGDAAYRDWAKEALVESGLDADEVDTWCQGNLYHQALSESDSGYAALRERIESIEAERSMPGNRVFYMAIPPGAFAPTIEGLGSSRLNEGAGWVRVVVEKPFGTDLESARVLNDLLLSKFDESEIYRIDHYLGKATVQNLLTFRFTNPMFERLWNRDRVSRVEITVAEDLGIAGRAGYYERAGVVRDMVQNHLTQLLALVAMEPPNVFHADRIRDEKVKVITAVAPVEEDDVVYGRYEAGRRDGQVVPGYLEEEGVSADSMTPTFVGIRLYVDTWRWQGIPFLLRTGKRLPQRSTHIEVTFREPALCVFHGRRDDCVHEPDVLRIILEPDEGFDLRFNVKSPDEDTTIDTQTLHFRYSDVYGKLPDAYQTLILDILEGDQTLFVRADEVEASWRLYDPLLERPPKLIGYTAGTWGPPEMDQGAPLGS